MIRVVGLMQNPSKTSAFMTDPTINKWRLYLSRWYPDRCWGIAVASDAYPREDGSTYRYSLSRQWRGLLGSVSLEIGNVFAYRATMSRDLWAAQRRGEDIVGPENDDHIHAMVEGADLVIAAWGVHSHTARAADRLIERVLRPRGVKLYALELSQDGRPKHPLYLRGDLQPVPWNP